LIVSEELELDEKRLLVEKCVQYKIELLSAPSPDDWKTTEQKIHKINKVRIEDLLGRPQNHVNTENIRNELKDKTVLITGAAGSIGSEIVRQLCRLDVKMLLLCDIAESPLHQLSLELSDNYPLIKKQLLVADVRNFERMKSIFEQYRPQYIYHAAAYKHVPLMEEQPSEAVLANVLGTKNVADLAGSYQSECFVMISTDKAVNPSSIMGTSKRIAEIYIQYLVHQQQPGNREKNPIRFITTRFGNVLGSNGSVIPRFTKQIEKGGPITVTHPDIIRYFMTISEACNLVLEASSIGRGGEIFVFDMGESVKITDMAESMIRLSGLEPYKDINIIFTGLRPGEKLYEELLYDKEKELPTRHEKIMISKLTECNYDEVIPLLLKLVKLATHDNQKEIVKLMKEIVPEFVSKNSIYGSPNDKN
jgi:FlaA1/EpsC-like NDP-sugar epimerase